MKKHVLIFLYWTYHILLGQYQNSFNIIVEKVRIIREQTFIEYHFRYVYYDEENAF